MRSIGEWFFRTWRENWLFVLVVGGILGAFVLLRTPGSDVTSVSDVDALLRDGRPTFIEFYSNT